MGVLLAEQRASRRGEVGNLDSDLFLMECESRLDLPQLPFQTVTLEESLISDDRHWGRGHLETGDYMLGTFRAHVHLSHNVTGG